MERRIYGVRKKNISGRKKEIPALMKRMLL